MTPPVTLWQTHSNKTTPTLQLKGNCKLPGAILTIGELLAVGAFLSIDAPLSIIKQTWLEESNICGRVRMLGQLPILRHVCYCGSEVMT